MPTRVLSKYGRLQSDFDALRHVVDLGLPELQIDRVERALAQARRARANRG